MAMNSDSLRENSKQVGLEKAREFAFRWVPVLNQQRG